MTSIDSIKDQIAATLRERGLRLATAESCTGGMLAAEITDLAGCSTYFMGGVIAYNNSIKTALLRVEESLLAEHGAVSAPVAQAMAEGALTILNADLALATTGIAGPGGGTDAKPVGLVFIALAIKKAATIVCECRFSGDRAAIRAAACATALNMLANRLQNACQHPGIST